MAEILTELAAKIIADATELKKGLADADKSMKGLETTAKKSTEGVARAYDNLGKTMIGIGAAIMTTLGMAAKSAMDAVESENLFTVSLERNADVARDWSNKLSKALGLNSYEIRKNVGTFYVMLKSMGLTSDAALEMSQRMTELSYDMASFYNLRAEEAFEKIQSGIVGMPRPLQDLGIIINETAIQTYALKTGLIEQGQEMTNQQKVIGRYGALMEATTTAQGDLARTMDSPTNRLRILSSTFEELKIVLGESILPVLNQLFSNVSTGLSSIRDFIKENKDLSKSATLGALSLGEMALVVGALLWLFPKLTGFVNGMGFSVIKLSSYLVAATAGMWAINEGMSQLSNNASLNTIRLEYYTEQQKALNGEANKYYETMLKFSDALKAYTEGTGLWMSEEDKQANYAYADSLRKIAEEALGAAEAQEKLATQTEQQIELTKQATEEAGKYIEQIRYENSEMGKLGITMDTFYSMMALGNVGTETIIDLYVKFGKEITNVDDLLEKLKDSYPEIYAQISKHIDHLKAETKAQKDLAQAVWEMDRANEEHMNHLLELRLAQEQYYNEFVEFQKGLVKGFKKEEAPPALTGFQGLARNFYEQYKHAIEHGMPQEYIELIVAKARAITIPSMQGGGVVEAPLGQPKLIMAHGGEQIIPPNIKTGDTYIIQGSVVVERQLGEMALKYATNKGRKDYTTGL